jgi:subtilisin family serine protease
VGLLVSASVLFAAESDLLELASREIIVKWRQNPISLDAVELLPEQAGRIESIRGILPVEDRRSPLSKLSVVRTDNADSAHDLLDQLKRDPRVEYAELRPIRYTDGVRTSRNELGGSLDVIPDDPFYSQQWGLQTVDAEAAWTEVVGDPSVAIAVVDVGVWFGHPELENVQWRNDAEVNGIEGQDDDGNGYIDDLYGYDFVGIDGDPMPEPFTTEQTHGTHVAGIAAALRNNGRGIAGIASGCKIIAVRVGQGNSVIYGYEGILYACRSGVKIINCSWGGGSDSQYEQEVIQYALDHECIVIASAGNGNTIERHYPSSLEGVLSVAATGIGDHSAVFSHYGPSVKVSAPGINILSTIWDENGNPSYAFWQGTSMSAPLVAGICALTKLKYPTLTGSALAARVIGSSEPIDEVNPYRAGWVGLGRVNAWRSVADELEGVRFDGITIEETAGDGDGRISPGETAALSISIYNELNPVGGVVGTIASTLDSLIISSPYSVYGNVPSGGPYSGGSPFLLTLDELSSRKKSIPITVDWANSEGRIIGRATQQIVMDTTWVAVDNGSISLGFGEDGSLGYHDYLENVTLGPGLRIAAGPTQTLYHGSFVLGVDGKVADNASGNGSDARYDWKINDGEYAHLIESERADIEAKTTFEDRGSEIFDQLFAKVEASAFTWNEVAAPNFMILEYTVTNRSVNPWENTFIGFFMDWDIVASDLNAGGYDAAGDLAFAEQFQEGFSKIGIASITHPLSTVQTLNNREAFDPDSSWDDDRIWEILNAGIEVETSQPEDISQIVAAGPLTVEAHSTVTVAFAIISGMSREELREAATAARSAYNDPVIEAKPNMDTARKRPAIYPNPVSSQGEMKLVLPENGLATVKFYNILGQLVGSFEQVKSGQAGTILDLSRMSTASGLLIYSIEVDGEQTLGKMVLLK